MTALDLIKKSATILNVTDVLEDQSLNTITKANSEDVLENNFALNRFFEILKIMLHDIASEYAPITKEKVCISDNKTISFAEFENLLKIVAVTIDKVPVRYKIYNNAIKTDFDGVFNVKYNVCPEIENLLDEIEVFDKGIGSDLLVYGVSSLYCLAVGLIDEFEVYNNLYSEKLSAIKTLKVIEMPARRWE